MVNNEVCIRLINISIDFFGLCRSPSSISSNFAYDNQIRNDLVELYQLMFGLNRPSCLPVSNEVIDSFHTTSIDNQHIFLIFI